MKIFFISFLLFIQFAIVSFADSGQCPFCNEAIQRKEQVFENQYFRVLLDYAPIVKGHLLIVPKRHIMKAHQLFKEEWDTLGSIVPKVVRVFQEVYAADQYIIIEKNGPLAGQTVPHVHFHLVPISSPEMAEQVKTALFAKFYDTSPKKLTEEETIQQVILLREHFERT